MKKICTILFAVFYLVACSKKQEGLQQYKTKYVGDNSKVIGIVSGLNYPNGLKYKSIEIQSEKEPYGLNVNLEGQQEASFFDQAVVTFAMIENLGELRYFNNQKELSSFSRGAVDLILEANGTNLNELNKDDDKLQEYIDKVNLDESK